MSTLRLTEPSPRKACKDGLVKNAGTEGERGLMNGESSLAPEMMGDVGRDEELGPGWEKTARSVKSKISPRLTIYYLKAYLRGITPSVCLYDSN